MSSQAYIHYVDEGDPTDNVSTDMPDKLATPQSAVVVDNGAPADVVPKIAELRGEDDVLVPTDYTASHAVHDNVLSGGGVDNVDSEDMRTTIEAFCDPTARAPAGCQWSYEVVLDARDGGTWQLRVSLGSPPEQREWDLDAPLGDALPLLRDVTDADEFYAICDQLAERGDHAATEGGQ